MNRLLRYRLTPLIATTGLAYWSILMLAPLEASRSILLCIASATWIIYPLDPLLDPRDRGPMEGPRVWTLLRLVIATICFFVAILQLQTRSQILVICGILLSGVYSIPLGSFRIKDHWSIKVPFVSLAVSIACVGIPWLQSASELTPDHFLLAAVMSLLVAANVIVCDIRDGERDEMVGLITLATRSPSIARRIVLIISMLLIPSSWLLYSVSETGARLSVGGVLVSAALLVIASTCQRKPVLLTVLADGSLAIPAILGWILLAG